MPVTLQEGYMDNWFVLLDERLQYVSDACVEGSAEEWAEMLTAIESGRACYFKRCAVQFNEAGASFWSPRNSMGRSWDCPRADLPALVESIRAALAPTKDGGGAK